MKGKGNLANHVLHLGDSLEILKTLAADSVDAVVTDPPYGFSFMGKKWDYELPSVELWEQVLRVLKPGGHLLGFGGARTYHRAVCRVEDAGFEIRDCVMWVYGSGFPKSLDVSKAIDKAAGAEREAIGKNPHARPNQDGVRIWVGDKAGKEQSHPPLTAPATLAAQQWAGWGTALKPAHEPIVLARKPLGEGTVAGNVMKWGTGGINVDGCRVECVPADFGDPNRFQSERKGGDSWDRQDKGMFDAGRKGGWANGVPSGRWPANFIHDGSDEVEAGFPVTTSGSLNVGHGSDTGSASRFFYCAKSSRSEREAGCDGLDGQDKYGAAGQWNSHDCFSGKTGDDDWKAKNPNNPARNHHPTVKPISLMRYLCRLITPPNGIILDPFMGSGTTGAAAMLEGFSFIGIEREPEYIEIAQRRIEHWKDEADEADEKQPELFESCG